MITLAPVSPTQIVQAGRLTVTATFTPAPATTVTRLEWFKDRALQASIPAPVSPFALEIPFSSLDAGEREVRVKMTLSSGAVEEAVLTVECAIPIDLQVIIPDPEALLRGSPHWLARVLEESKISVRVERYPAAWLDWPGGPRGELISERLAVYTSTNPEIFPAQIMTATQWLLARDTRRGLVLFRTIVEPETLRLWQGLETLSAGRLQTYLAGGEFAPFGVNLLELPGV